MKNKKIYVHGIVKDYECNLEKYLFSENERLNAIIDDLEDKIYKAIEYIKNNIDNTGWLEIGSSNVNELLEILGDKE